MFVPHVTYGFRFYSQATVAGTSHKYHKKPQDGVKERDEEAAIVDDVLFLEDRHIRGIY
jgi:hypothetical protein